MDRHRIVDRGLDALLGERLHQALPIRRTYCVDVIDVPSVGRLGGDRHAAIREQGAIARRVRSPRLGPPFEVAQLDAQDRALDTLHPVVVARQRVMVLAVLAPVPQHADGARLLLVARYHHPALAVRAKVLARVVAEAGEVAEAADGPAIVLRAVCLSGVLNDEQFVSLRHREQRVHVGRLAVEVDRKDRFGARGDRRLDPRRVYGEGGWINVDEDGSGTRVPDRGDGGHEGVRDGDDFVARSDAGCQHRKMQRAGATVEGNAMHGAAVSGELALEGSDLVAEYELRALQDTLDRRIDLLLDAVVLRLEVEEGDHQLVALHIASSLVVPVARRGLPAGASTGTPPRGSAPHASPPGRQGWAACARRCSERSGLL